MFAPYVQQQEDWDYEISADYDAVHERFAGEDLSRYDAEDYDAQCEEAAAEAAERGVFDAHVIAKRIHDSAIRIAAGAPWMNDDIPF